MTTEQELAGAEELVDDNAQRDAIILEKARRAREAPEPGSLDAGELRAEGAGIQKVTVESAGHVWLYNTKTGEPSRINRNAVAAMLGKRHPDGSPAFDVVQRVKPFRGDVKCLLHKDHAEREVLNANGLSGLPYCPAEHLASPFAAEQHMAKRHPAEWKAIQATRERLEKLEDRAMMRSLVTGIAASPDPHTRLEGVLDPKLPGVLAEEAVEKAEAIVQEEMGPYGPIYVPDKPKKRGRAKKQEG